MSPGGYNDVPYYRDMKIPSIDLKEYLELLKRNYPQLLPRSRQPGAEQNFLP